MTQLSDKAAHSTNLVYQLADMSDEALHRMLEAGDKINNCYRLLQKHEQHGNVVREVLREQGTFYELEHYPKGDVHDSDSHSQYFYHAHRGIDGENGHFHTFLRAKGMQGKPEAVPYDGEVEWPAGDDALSHLIAVSMDPRGYPLGLFSTNRWVTGETWYKAEDVIAMLDSFKMDMLYPSWPVNIWLTECMRLFRPQIEELLIKRDESVDSWANKYPDKDVYEDRDLEVTSELLVDVDKQLDAINNELSTRGSQQAKAH